MKRISIIMLLAVLTGGFNACSGFLDIFPDDNITGATMWNEPGDATLALNGAYEPLHDRSVFGYGPGFDAVTPNGYQWAYWENQLMQIGDGTATTTNASTYNIVKDRWRDCYKGIHRINELLANIDNIPDFGAAEKERVLGEAYFLRAVYYDLLVRSYGEVPLILEPITVAESKLLARATLAESWAQVHQDFDEAIKRLPVNGQAGQAVLGAAYGMKMKSYLYTLEYGKVLEYCDKLDALGKYSLFPSYQGLFQLANENNVETVFALSFMAGANGQGSIFDRFFQCQNLKYGIDGSNSVMPTHLLVDEYETLDGSPVDPNNKYANRDPRLDFTILRPGAYFQGQLYPNELQNHSSAKIDLALRKYTIETDIIIQEESPLDFMILRYGDVLLCRAEAMIELNQNIDGAIDLINRIRTERTDVKMPPLPKGLSQAEARAKLRHERRIELAFENQYWDDIKRWNIGPDIYPCDVIDFSGGKIQTKFAMGYKLEKDNRLPIHDTDLTQNTNDAGFYQNPGW